MNIGMSILLELDPLVSYDRAAGALNVVGASSSASRSLLDTNTANYIYVNTSTGNDTTGTGAVGAPYKTLTKAYSVWSSGKVVHVVNSDAITLGSGAETTTSIDRPTQAAVGVAPVMTLSGEYTLSTTTRPASTTGDVSGVAHNGATIVVVTATGKICSGTTTASFTNRTPAANFGGGGVVFGNGKFIAYDGTGDVSSSTDGTTWGNETKASGATTASCAAYGHLGFMIAGTDGLQKSTDGSTWTFVSYPASLSSSVAPDSAIYANGAYYIYFNNNVLKTTDLINITHTATASIEFSGGSETFNQYISYGNGVFLNFADGSYSTDGLSFTQNTNNYPLVFGNGGGYACGFCGNKFVTIANGFTYYSGDGITWSSTAISGEGSIIYLYDTHSGVICGAAAGNDFKAFINAIKLKGSFCGFDITSDGLAVASANAAVTVLNCDVDYGIDAIKDAQGFSVKNSVVRNIRANENIMAELSETLVTGNVELFKNYASTNDVNRNTIIGAYSDWDTTTTDIDQFRDNVIEGGIKSNRVLTVDSGNVRGYVSPSVTFATSMVSEVDPLFVTAGSDYRLATAADGTASPLLELSTFYDPDGTAGTGRDYGAYSFDYAGIATTWQTAITLPRPVGVVSKDQIAGVYNRAIGGNQLGVNYTDAAAERIELNWNSLDAASYGQLKTAWMTIESCRARLTWNVDGTGSAFTVTADGGEATGSNKITIDASNNAPPGAKITIAGVDYFVLRISPPEGPATKLTLNKDLESTIANNDVLNVEQVAGNGEYTIIWPTVFDRNPFNSRMINDPQMAFRGCTIAFARAASASGVGE